MSRSQGNRRTRRGDIGPAPGAAGPVRDAGRGAGGKTTAAAGTETGAADGGAAWWAGADGGAGAGLGRAGAVAVERMAVVSEGLGRGEGWSAVAFGTAGAGA